ncbi:tRNA lysidine(34) synthetase TilS [Streptococcus sp. H31]|uniref:tRNA lysidine(34) synthetase TilS n=1 Tax=Streptococcus huangxiaojuni TaxID=3237239 RepID=UPI0034A464CE
MNQKILTHIQEKAYFTKHHKVLIAVSGGADSMNLLHFLYAYQKELAIEIGIAHVNYKQRPEADDEEAYLKKWAFNYSVPIFTRDFSGSFSENAARRFRYFFFKEVMSSEHYTAVVTAHHADDQAETIFMRLIRGSRLRHLSGIADRQTFGTGELIRPFLPFPKEDWPDIFHFEDASNQTSAFLRNRVRNHYLPALEAENPKIKESLQSLGAESRFVFQALKDLTAHIKTTDCHEFLQQTEPVQMVLLQAYLEEFPDLQVSKGQFNEILHLIQTHANCTYAIKKGYYLLKSYDSFEIKKISPETYRSSKEKVVECDSIVKYGQYRFSFKQDSDNKETEIPIFSLSPILLREKRDGDRINFGKFTKKLSRLFIDEKFSFQERANAVIGEQEGDIIFVLIAGKTYLRKASNRDIMKATLHIEKLEDR